MECNRDEALRAREIAQKKFMDKDNAGAVKFAHKAQNLYPSLEGISQVISTLNVYVAADNLINGEKDWYGIFRVDASADEAMLKKQYKRLALLFHPDKNSSFGADGAFKLISEAWNVLSDRNRRLVYDHKRNHKANKPAPPPPPPPSSRPNGFRNFASNAASNMKPRKSSAAPAAPAPHSQKPLTFWTKCKHCSMKYEYLMVYINQILLCPNCHQPFMAAATEKPMNGTSSAVPQPPMSNHHNRTSQGACGRHNSNFQWGPFSRSAGLASAAASSTAAAQAVNVVHQTYEKVRKEREEKQAAATRKDDVVRKHPFTSKEDQTAKRRKITVETSSSAGADGKHTDVNGIKSVPGTTASAAAALDVEMDNGGFGHGHFRSITRDFSYANIQKMLIQNAKLVIKKNLEHFNQTQRCNDDCVPEKKSELQVPEKKSELQVPEKKSELQVPEKHAKSADPTLQVPELSVSSLPSDASCNGDPTTDEKVENSDSFQVPDADFHDFDSDRTEKDFEQNQVWAIYDQEDGMPRYYVRILKILSLKPFKIRISYLNSKGNSEFSRSLDWTGKGFSKTCGHFKVGGHTIFDMINMFSHRVNLDKMSHGIIRIFPKKGEIWAIYTNWSSDWDDNTEYDVVYKYDMVVVLDDYNEEQGMITVCPLVKAAGFKTVFHRPEHNDDVQNKEQQPKSMITIPREEMFRFSHQVPSYVLTGEEAHNAPKGYHELDPAATPPELLQVAPISCE